MELGSSKFTCTFCGLEQRVTRGSWEFVHAQVLMHFNSCVPPNRFHETEHVMEAAARLTDEIVAKRQ